MAKFVFRLEKVLEFRRLEEGWAKREMAQVAAEIAELELEMASLDTKSDEALRRAATEIVARLTLLDHLRSLDEAKAILARQRDESQRALEAARTVWQAKRADLRAMEELEARERRAWEYEESRREQAELDEWAVLRRVA